MLLFVGIGAELVGIILAMYFIGLNLPVENKENWTAGLIVLGFIGWFAHIIFLLKKTFKDEIK